MPINWRNGWPCCDSRGAAESGRVTMPPVHKFGWPDRHCAQLPQKPERQATIWSPGLTDVTSAPTASTTPAPSWPSTIGRSSGKRPSPSTTWRSLWHTPVATVRTSTSRPPGWSMSTGSIVSGSCTLRNTAALISIAFFLPKPAHHFSFYHLSRPLRTHSTGPKRLRGEARAFGERSQLAPDEIGMDAAAEAAIGAGNDVFAAGDCGVTQDTVGDQLRVLDEVGGMADDAGHQHLARRQLRGLPNAPFMLVPHIGGLEGIGLRLHLKDQIDDVLERQVVRVRPVPAAPAQMVAHFFFGNAGQRVVDGVDAQSRELAVCLDRWFRFQHVPPVRQAGIVDL